MTEERASCSGELMQRLCPPQGHPKEEPYYFREEKARLREKRRLEKNNGKRAILLFPNDKNRITELDRKKHLIITYLFLVFSPPSSLSPLSSS